MKESKQFLVEGSDYEFSLSKFLGKKIVDVVGYPSASFGYDVPVFAISKIIFEDGSSMWVEGEHDVAYLPADEKDGLSEERLLDYIEREEDEDDN